MIANKLLIGKKAIDYIKNNPMTVIRVPNKDVMLGIIQNYSNEIPIALDITEMNENARLLLLKFAEERINLTCLTRKDIQDPILLSRFNVEKESTLLVTDCANMPIMEFAEIYRDCLESVKNEEMTDLDLKKMILENCPIFITLPKNKVLDIIIGG